MALIESIPKWVFLQLLEDCNLRCGMCYEWGEKGSYKKIQHKAQLDIARILNVIKECSAFQPHYELFGGEPLLYPHIEELLSAINKYGSTVDIPTNGTLLIEYAELMIQAQVTKLWISLDGPEFINDRQRGKGVFKKVIAGIETLYNLREKRKSPFPKIGISMVITPLNHLHVKEFFFNSVDIRKLDHISLELQAYITKENYDLYRRQLKHNFKIEDLSYANGFIRDIHDFSDLNITKLNEDLQDLIIYCDKNDIFLNTYPKIISEKNIRLYFNGQWSKLDGAKKFCTFPWISAEISARGNVTTCHSFYDLTLGNIYSDSLEAIWNGHKYDTFRKYLKKNQFGICPACCLYYRN